MPSTPRTRRKSPRARRYKHLIWLLDTWLRRRVCVFCHEPLWSRGCWYKQRRPPVTIHHRNGDHDDDTPANQAWAHAPCHRRHHLAERWIYARRIRKARGVGNREAFRILSKEGRA